MIEKQFEAQNQVSEFLAEYGTRFNVINIPNMPGKVGYTSKLNRIEQCSLNIYLTDKFPFQAPLMFVEPKISIPGYLDEIGRVRDSCLSGWNVKSTLTTVTKSVLLRLEYSSSNTSNSFSNSKSPSFLNNDVNKSNSFNQNISLDSLYIDNRRISQFNTNNNQTKPDIYENINNLYSKQPYNNPLIPNNDINTSNTNSNNITSNISNSTISDILKTKSIEELIYISLNQEEFVSEYTSQLKENLNKAKNNTNIIFSKSIYL
jgi:hypothetical protein